MSLRAQRADELISVPLGLESQNEKNNCPLPAFAYPFMLPVGFRRPAHSDRQKRL